MTTVNRTRLRLRYRKDQVLKYIGHRDLLRLILRLLRQAKIPIATSGRFSPKPRIAFSPPLPLGVIAYNELLDIELDEKTHWTTHDVQLATDRLIQAAAPRNLVSSLVLLSSETPVITRLISGARYLITCNNGAEWLAWLTGAKKPTSKKDDNFETTMQGIRRVNLYPQGVEADGDATGKTTLNIVRLASLLAKNTSSEYTELCRSALLNHEGQPL